MKLTDLYDPGDYVYISDDRMQNLRDLVERMNHFESIYGKALQVTSGYRSISKHKKIYASINEARKIEGKPPIPTPMYSKHLMGQAVDCYDASPQKELRLWIMLNKEVLDECRLWCEKLDEVPRVHFQSAPFASWEPGMSRFFRPF